MTARDGFLERPVVFACGDDSLLGILHESAQPATLGVLVIVGGPQYRVGSHRQFVLMARDLARSGVPVFRFDYRGMGDSDGAARTFEAVEEDVAAALDAFFREQPQVSGVVLWGLCDAASVALMVCRQDPRVRGVIVANPWVRTQSGEARTYLRHYYVQRFMQRSFWRKLLSGAFNPFRSAQELAATVDAARGAATPRAEQESFIERMRAGLESFAGPILILISERDLTAQEFVDLCSADPKWQSALAAPNRSSCALPDADHTFSDRRALAAATERCVQWLTRLRGHG